MPHPPPPAFLSQILPSPCTYLCLIHQVKEVFRRSHYCPKVTKEVAVDGAADGCDAKTKTKINKEKAKQVDNKELDRLAGELQVLYLCDGRLHDMT